MGQSKCTARSKLGGVILLARSRRCDCLPMLICTRTAYIRATDPSYGCRPQFSRAPQRRQTDSSVKLFLGGLSWSLSEGMSPVIDLHTSTRRNLGKTGFCAVLIHVMACPVQNSSKTTSSRSLEMWKTWWVP